MSKKIEIELGTKAPIVKIDGKKLDRVVSFGIKYETKTEEPGSGWYKYTFKGYEGTAEINVLYETETGDEVSIHEDLLEERNEK